MATSLVWFYLFVAFSLILFLLVPREEILNLLPFGLVGGFVVALILQYFAVNVFRWWKFNYGWVEIFNTPLGVSLSWIPPVIIFAYFWSITNSIWGKLIYIFSFALITTIGEYIFVITEYRRYLNWNVYLTLVLAFVIHLLLGSYLEFRRQKIN
ncbi:MAG: hypothetical protein ACQEP9_06830 [Bacillota bacterium]